MHYVTTVVGMVWVQLPVSPVISTVAQLIPKLLGIIVEPPADLLRTLHNNNNITIYKAHNVRKKLNLRRRQSLGGGKSNSV